MRYFKLREISKVPDRETFTSSTKTARKTSRLSKTKVPTETEERFGATTSRYPYHVDKVGQVSYYGTYRGRYLETWLQRLP